MKSHVINWIAVIAGLTTISLQLTSCNGMTNIKTVHSANPESSAVNGKKESKPTGAIKTGTKLSDLELAKYAYEVGIDPSKELSAEDLAAIEKRKKVRYLERTLDSQKERLNYSKILPWLQNDDEKVSYLLIPSIEGRQSWINKNKIWKRAQSLRDFNDLVDDLDIAAGMPSDYVKKSWGEPVLIEHSGNPIYKNERWKYFKQVSTPNGYRQEKRYVYFEGGRVVGWETE